MLNTDFISIETVKLGFNKEVPKHLPLEYAECVKGFPGR